jgi:AcrR family transcriptional regulator
MPLGRVEQRREGVREEIKQAARRLMAEHGTAGLSLRAIAREINMQPSGLYHYYGSLDELITALIVEAFNALADALEAARETAAGQSSAAQLIAVLQAYRRWAMTHPTDFQLIYGNPIPGYAAPREITVPPVIRGFSVIVGLIENLLQSGALEAVPPYDHMPPEIEARLQELIERDGYPVSARALFLGAVGWTQLHGIIMLEMFNHLQPVVGDADVFYRAQVINLLKTMGLKTAV